MKLRNPLFAPADQPRKIAKALDTDADLVILDLEDSVAPGNKVAARDGLAEALTDADLTRVCIRVNPSDTQWHADDVEAAAACRPAAIMFPKCAGPDDLAQLAAALDRAGSDARILALPTETVAATRNMRYAGVTDRLVALCFGAEDLSSDLGVVPRRADASYTAAIAHARGEMLLAAAEAGVLALDTPWPDPRDPDGLASEAAAAALDGFAGKLCIHPAQLEPVATAFTPDADRLAWARAVRDAFAAQPDAGVLSLDGKMIDKPHLKLAARLLAAAGE